MDYIKFALLTTACIGGFMATSYSSLARQKGWSIGALFNNERMSPIIIGGFLCQFGSPIISFFVNPWWSALIVFTLGFVGYIVLSSILKVYSQLSSLILILVSFIVIPIYIFSNPSTNENLKHFKASISYSNEAAKISNGGQAYEIVDHSTIEKMLSYKKQALAEASAVDINALNQRLEGFGDHYKNEFIKGLKTHIEGFKNNDPDKFLKGQILLDQWGIWYSKNIQKIKNGK